MDFSHYSFTPAIIFWVFFISSTHTL
jgi:hypothetical protein